MQMKWIVLVSTWLFGSMLYGQKLLPVMYDSTMAKQQIILYGNAFTLSTSLQNAFTQKILFGGQISSDLSNTTYKKLHPVNRLGGGAHFGIEYRGIAPIFKKNKAWSWMINISESAHFYGLFSDDLFGLTFMGNSTFLGKSVSLKNLTGRFDQFLSLGGGIHNRKTKTYVVLNAVFPQNFFQLEMDRGNISFSPNGDAFDLNANGNVLIANDYTYFKGIGASLNFGYYLPFGKKDKFHGIIAFTGKNLGAYYIHNTQSYTIDLASKHYEGYSIEKWMNTENKIDLMDTLNITNEQRDTWKLLPGYLQIGKIVDVDSMRKWQPFFGVRMYLNKINRPMVYLGINYQPITPFSLGLQGSFGGYGNFRLGFYVNYNTTHWNIGLGTEDILGAFLGNQLGYSGLIRIGWKL